VRVLPVAITAGRAVVTARRVVTTWRAIVNRWWPVIDRLLHVDRCRLVINRWWLLYINRRWLVNRLRLYIDRPIGINQGRTDDGRTHQRAKDRWSLPAITTTTAMGLCLPCDSECADQQGNCGDFTDHDNSSVLRPGACVCNRPKRCRGDTSKTAFFPKSAQQIGKFCVRSVPVS
jgi:hypothetical protein